MPEIKEHRSDKERRESKETTFVDDPEGFMASVWILGDEHGYNNRHHKRRGRRIFAKRRSGKDRRR